jgi:hypothetical protein
MPTEQLSKNLRRLIESWRDRKQAMSDLERKVLIDLEHQLMSVVVDAGRSHLVSARPYETVWRRVPEVVMVHHDATVVYPGVVREFDGDEDVVLLVECTAGCAHIGSPLGKATDDDPYCVPADAATTKQVLHQFAMS